MVSEPVEQQPGQGEVAQVVGRHLQLEAVGGLAVGRAHDAGVVDEEVEAGVLGQELLGRRGAPTPGRTGRAGGSRATSGRGRSPSSSQARRAFSGSRQASTTWAPWSASAAAVSYPMPLLAPVTSATVPVRSPMSSVPHVALATRPRRYAWPMWSAGTVPSRPAS